MDNIKLDFQQAIMKHIGFKSKLRAILYGSNMEEEPVASEYECAVGKWIYGHALEKYSHIPEMHELEKVHASIHFVARNLLALYHDGKGEEARTGLAEVNAVADKLVGLLATIETKLTQPDQKE